MIQFPEFEHIKNVDPKLYDGLQKMSKAFLEMASKSGVGVGGSHTAPPTIGGLEVSSQNGWVVVKINDPAGAGQGIIRPLYYTVLYDVVPSLNIASSFPHPCFCYRTAKIYVGNATYYFGAYSFYSDAEISPIITFATPVFGGGTLQPPALPSPPAGGMSGIGPGGGFGRGLTRPKS